jgi:hypothetical protein
MLDIQLLAASLLSVSCLCFEKRNSGFGDALTVVLVTWGAVSKEVFLYMGL